jgi:hypothetical protein
MKIFIICLIIISLFIIFWIINKKKTIYSIKDFNHINLLSMNIDKNFDLFLLECKDILNLKSFSFKKRKAGVWDNAENYIKNLKDEWIYGWNNDNKWFNYPLVYKGKILPYISKESVIYKLLNNKEYLSKINVCGLSLLKSNGFIEKHNDPDTTISKGRLAYHYNIFGNSSIININGKNYKQIPKGKLLFDSGYNHFVKNGVDDRLILYIDFQI